MTRPTPSEEWYVLLKDWLPAYISWERYEQNIERLAENRARSDAMGIPRSGDSLLQGLLVCGRCGRRMTIRYGKRCRHNYYCQRLKTDYGGPPCQHLVGAPLDELVSRKVLEALEPAALELSLEAAEHIEKERAELDELWQKRLERASYEADRAGRHYRLLEPENRLVARQLAKDWEEKLAAGQRLQEDYDRFRQERPKVLSEQEREAIRSLSQDLPGLWEAQTTPNEDRKQIVRQVIERIAVNVEGTSERVKVEIHWAGGATTEEEMVRPVAKLEQLSYYPELCERIRELAAEGLNAKAVADRLNQEGYRPPKRRQKFGAQGIGNLMRRLGLGAESRFSHTSGQGELLDEDEWLLSGLALELGMPKITLHSWLKRGWLKARRGQKRSGQWIVWADEEEVERLRRLRALPAGYNVRQMWLR